MKKNITRITKQTKLDVIIKGVAALKGHVGRVI